MLVVLGSFLLTVIVLVQAPAAQGPPSADEIADAVRRLGDDEFSIREQATDFLWRVGKPAQTALEAAVENRDREIATRASELLERISLGILPDTPPQLIHLIRSYQRGDLQQKRVVLTQLRQGKRQSTVFSLIRGEQDKTIRKQLGREFVGEGRAVAIELLAAGDTATAEEILSWTAGFDESTRSQRDYAAYLFLTGRLDDKIAELRRDDWHSDNNAARLLATLLQVDGKLREALEVANLAGDKALQNDLLYRLEDWSALAREEQLPDGLAVEKLGAKAAYRQWGGD
jgi:hypothetical protein